MKHVCDYTLTKQADGAFSLSRTNEPFPGTVAFIKPAVARTGQQAGWRLKPLVTMQGAKSKIWLTAAEAIAATKLMTLAAAKYAVEEATCASSSQNAEGAP
jgi:hypothetical protein